MVIGIDLDLYRTFDGYDKFVHALSGVFATLIAAEALQNSAPKSDPRFKLLFMVSFVGLTAAGWEAFEFLYDHTFGGHMQQLISQGLDDTMWDIIFALAAGFIASCKLSESLQT